MFWILLRNLVAFHSSEIILNSQKLPTREKRDSSLYNDILRQLKQQLFVNWLLCFPSF